MLTWKIALTNNHVSNVHNNILLVVVFLSCLHAIEALIPRECAGALGNGGICCPTPPGFQLPCGGAGRGTCSKIVAGIERNMGYHYTVDDRLLWPTKLFPYMCRCKAHFFGPSCNECWYGWTGVNCDQRVTKVRKNLVSLSPSERLIFRRVIQRSATYTSDYLILIEQNNVQSDPMVRPTLMEGSVQHVFASIHRYTARGTLFNNENQCKIVSPLNFNHNSCAFLTWHRYCMLFWERQLEKLAANVFGIQGFSLPYWDWIDQTSCNVCTDDLAGGMGNLQDRFGEDRGQRLSRFSEFYDVQEFCPEPTNKTTNCYGCHANAVYRPVTRAWKSFSFPTTADLDYAMIMIRFHSPIQLPSQEGCISFDTALEGFCARPNHPSPNLSFMHNRLHNMVKGSFCCSSTSVSDPIFILHHVQIDRIFEAWLRNNPGTPANMDSQSCMPGHCYSCNMVGFLPPVRNSQMYTTSNNLGYIYDNFNFGKHGRTF